jgi:hypothetical protein
MKKILYSVLVVIGAAFLLSSCADFLDKQPSQELTEEQVFDDWALMIQYHYDTYDFLRHGAGRVGTWGMYGAGGTDQLTASSGRSSAWLDAATDLAQTSYSSGVSTSFNVGNYYNNGGATELIDTWGHYYKGIRKCNMLLARIENVPKGVDLSDEAYATDKLNYISEARFLRAWFYWELFLRYGPVPIVKDVLNPEGDLLSGYTTRPGLKEYVVDFILAELRDCEAGLKSFSSSNQSGIEGRIGQPMARALYSRIMLYMASPRFSSESGVTWQQAADAAKSFIDTYGANYSLMTSIANTWLIPAYLSGNTEAIFYRNDGAIEWGMTFNTYKRVIQLGISDDSPVGEGGNGGTCPSQNLIDMYDMIDGSSPFAQYDETGAPVYNGVTPAVNPESGYSDATMWTRRDRRLAASILYNGVEWGNGVINVVHGQRDNPIGNSNATQTGYYLRKYIPEAILASNHSGTAYRQWTIIRYAEILLNYAEAVNEAEGPNQIVWDMLDQVRSRAGITGSVADRADLATKEAMRNFIRKERTVEFAFEEHRWWDVRRWNVAEKALARDIIGIDVSANGTITRKVAGTRMFEPRMYLYPIPEGEIWKTGLENNPGW